MKYLFTFLSMLLAGSLLAQNADDFEKTFLPIPRNYTIQKTSEPIVIDGKDNEGAWQKAPWSEPFSDIEGTGGSRYPYVSRHKMLWDNENLYIYIKMDETQLWAIHRTTDIVFRENVLKMFLDPDNSMHDYFEIQINPYNEVYYLMLNRPYRDKGSLLTGWEPAGGGKSAVAIVGTINDPSDEDTGWTIEIALPFKSFNARSKPPVDGSIWRFDVQRTNYTLAVKDGVYSKELDTAGKALPQQNTSWSPPKMTDIQFPERWGYLQFSSIAAGGQAPAFVLPYTEHQRRYLWAAYYLQKDWLKKNGKYAAALAELGIPENSIGIEEKNNKLTMEATSRQFLISIADESGRQITINQDGLVR